ncbi:hypothetical protein [Spirosoma fluminis]
MKLVNLPATLHIEHDVGTDFAKKFSWPFALTNQWQAQVSITTPGKPDLSLSVGAGLTINQGKLVFTLTQNQLNDLVNREASWSLSLIAPDGARKKYFTGQLTIS